MNQPSRLTDPEHSWLSAVEATRRLGVKRETLYAYASRGLIRSVADGIKRSRLYSRDDVERLKARSGARAGHAAVAAGAMRWGEPVLETAVGTIDGRGPIYRGQAALELALAGTSFEAVCARLWDSPYELPAQRAMGIRSAALRCVLGASAEPFDAMLLAAAALAATEPRSEPVSVVRQRAALTLRRLIAACALPRTAAVVRASLEAPDAASAVLRALGGRVTRASLCAVETALILSADHELNPSTFAARISASAEANLAACLLSALCTLSGPQHGRETARVEAFLDGIEGPRSAAAAVAARLERGDRVPGFGHPLYPAGDPRGAHLLGLAGKLAPRAHGVRTLLAVRSAMALRVREHPTLDLGLVALAHALDLRAGSALALFACGRLAGHVAHVLEQRSAGYVLRPRARYVGPLCAPLSSSSSLTSPRTGRG